LCTVHEDREGGWLLEKELGGKLELERKGSAKITGFTNVRGFTKGRGFTKMGP
jgi:hypothetical protein